MNGENKPFVRDYSKYTVLGPVGHKHTDIVPLSCNRKPVVPTGKMPVLL